ncbi:phage gp6-like head-tail connector protein [Brevibacillus laterosporus]|uniref:phage gp6-like head-tail connector protein n=1 Tax=Brevibacillus laterosporus TaxID=1465 RepID=UPI000E6C3D99|nr:phage gp6-like head-tail connector protein [Brevibacillus laterosporus]AYB36801.1 phage gp6-like head-tail connector protein [Brevibacillus laterosporus]AYB41048.1 phage gp6-like head-tail connector protein [Brevibacillus laterosporus]MBM7106964.1 Phage gp6-like head-tail connector protein [Brevibacillus laterosporus]
MLTTLVKAKKLMGIPAENETRDVEIFAFLSASSTAIENYCRRSFGLHEYKSQKYDGGRSKYLLLKNFPVHSVSRVQIHKMEIKDYEIIDDKGMLFRTTGWQAKEREISISYIAGYVLPADGTEENPCTLPEPLELACILYCQTLMRTPGVSTERVGDISVSYTNEGENIPFAVKSLINPYRREP